MNKRYPLTDRTRNLVRFCRHLPSETMAADFAADFAFRARGSRFSLLKNPRTAPGPDEFYGAFSGDVRLICEKLLGLEIEFVGIEACQGAPTPYNSMAYYRSHIEEHFSHAGVRPLPPLEGECRILFEAADVLRVTYRLHATSPADVPLRLRWVSRLPAEANGHWRAVPGGWELELRQQATDAYVTRVRLSAPRECPAFEIAGLTGRTTALDCIVPGGGEREFVFEIAASFNEEPARPAAPRRPTAAVLDEAIAEVEALYGNLPLLQGPFAAYEKLVLKAAGTLYSLRYRDRDRNGQPVDTIHAGKTGVVATWFGDTSYTLIGLGLLGDRRTSRGAARLLLDGIREDGRPCTVYKGGAYHYHNYQAPWLAWGLGHNLAMLPDDAFLAEAYEPLVRYARHWLREHLEPRWGLLRSHWGNVGDDGLRCYSAMPLAPRAGEEWGRRDWGRNEPERFASPDVNAHFVLELRSLARMARRLGKPDDDAEWERLADALAAAINRHLLEPERGVYLDRRLDDGRFGDMVSMASFVPLQAGIAPRDTARAIARRYLLDENRFYTTLPFSTLDRSHPCFRSGGVLGTNPAHPGALIPQAYWIGRTWPHYSAMHVTGLHQAGLEDEAQAAALKILDALDREEAINECYDSLTGQGNGHPEFMWSSAAVLILATQYYRKFS